MILKQTAITSLISKDRPISVMQARRDCCEYPTTGSPQNCEWSHLRHPHHSCIKPKRSIFRPKTLTL